MTKPTRWTKFAACARTRLNAQNAASLKTTAKLLATGSIIAAIAGLFLVLNPDAEVESSRADIVATEFSPRSQAARFVDSLRALGHSEPLALELNGNRIFSSSAHFAERPAQVLARYQREFVRQRLNEREFLNLGIDSWMQRERAGISGQVVPQKISDRHIIMSGVDQASGARDPSSLLRAFRPDRSPAETFSAYRWVEIYREPGADTTTVMATWSDETFDYARMRPVAGVGAADRVDDLVPICPKCTLDHQMADLGSPGTYSTYIFTTSHSPRQLLTFYTARLTAQGWAPDLAQPLRQAARQRLGVGMEQLDYRRFSRDGWTFQLTIFPIDSRTRSVHIELMDPVYLESLAE